MDFEEELQRLLALQAEAIAERNRPPSVAERIFRVSLKVTLKVSVPLLWSYVLASLFVWSYLDWDLNLTPWTALCILPILLFLVPISRLPPEDLPPFDLGLQNAVPQNLAERQIVLLFSIFLDTFPDAPTDANNNHEV